MPRLSAELRERETVKPLELYFDLVFVLGFTQCTALMAAQPSWQGIARGMLVLAVLWWAWAGYAWLTSVIDPEEGAVRLVMFAAMAGLMVVALCVPEAFDERALVFAVAYGVVRAAHIGLFVIASRDDPALRRSVLGLAASTALGVALLTGAWAVDGVAQGALWTAAMLVDWGGPAIVGVAGWRLVPGHFAERHNLVIILALGESIVALGVGAEVHLDVGVITAVALGVAVASALWWVYFDVVALVTARRLVRATEGRLRNTLARDSYSYLHFPIVAGDDRVRDRHLRRAPLPPAPRPGRRPAGTACCGRDAGLATFSTLVGRGRVTPVQLHSHRRWARPGDDHSPPRPVASSPRSVRERD